MRVCVSYLLYPRIHSSVDGHLDRFHVLDTVNSAVINMCVFELELSLDICPGVALQGHMVALFLLFREPPYCSLYSLPQFAFLPTVWEGPLFSTASPAFLICRLFEDDPSD